MSLNDKSCSSTPSIVRDFARFGSCTVTTSLEVTGSCTIGDSTLGDAFTVTATQTYNGPEYHNGPISMANQLTCNGALVAQGGFASTGATTLGDASTDTLTVGATSTFNAPTTIAAGMRRTVFSSSPIGSDVSVAWTDSDFQVFSPSTSGLAVRLLADGATPNYVQKTIKNAYGSGNNLAVYSGAIQLANLTPGTETTVETLSARWY